MSDPFSKCYEVDHPCAAGEPCIVDDSQTCTEECGNYICYSEEADDLDMLSAYTCRNGAFELTLSMAGGIPSVKVERRSFL